MLNFDAINMIALGWFACHLLFYAWMVDWGPMRVHSLSVRMARQRRLWIDTMIGRENRIMDTQILSGLQHGTAFFASSSLLAIGGSFSLLTSSVNPNDLAHRLGLYPDGAPWEPKALLLLSIYGYAFFKLGWAYRLFNYAAILMGAIAPFDVEPSPQQAVAKERCIRFIIIAGRQFTRGLRAFFLSVPVLLWFAGPWAFIVSTTAVTLVLLHRQFKSSAHDALGLEFEQQHLEKED